MLNAQPPEGRDWAGNTDGRFVVNEEGDVLPAYEGDHAKGDHNGMSAFSRDRDISHDAPVAADEVDSVPAIAVVAPRDRPKNVHAKQLDILNLDDVTTVSAEAVEEPVAEPVAVADLKPVKVYELPGKNGRVNDPGLPRPQDVQHGLTATKIDGLNAAVKRGAAVARESLDRGQVDDPYSHVKM